MKLSNLDTSILFYFEFLHEQKLTFRPEAKRGIDEIECLC